MNDTPTDRYETNAQGPDERATLSIAEAATRLGLSQKATRSAVRLGRLKAIRVGRRWLVLKAPLEKMLSGPEEDPPM